MVLGFSAEREIFGQKGFFITVDANYLVDIDCIICDVVSRFKITRTNFLLCSSVEITESTSLFCHLWCTRTVQWTDSRAV